MHLGSIDDVFRLFNTIHLSHYGRRLQILRDNQKMLENVLNFTIITLRHCKYRGRRTRSSERIRRPSEHLKHSCCLRRRYHCVTLVFCINTLRVEHECSTFRAYKAYALTYGDSTLKLNLTIFSLFYFLTIS